MIFEIYLARLEVRVERIEQAIADIKTSLSTTWALLIWNFASLATLLSIGFGWL